MVSSLMVPAAASLGVLNRQTQFSFNSPIWKAQHRQKCVFSWKKKCSYVDENVPWPQCRWMVLLQIALQGEFLLGSEEDNFCNGVDHFFVWQPLAGSQCLQVLPTFTLVLPCPAVPREGGVGLWKRENCVQDAMEFMAAFAFLGHQGLRGQGELLLLGIGASERGTFCSRAKLHNFPP